MLVMPICCRRPLGVLTGRPGPARGRGRRRDRQKGGEILSALIYHKEEE
jgi:hypothetical protein